MLKIIHSSLFIILLFSYSLTARVLSQDVVWNEEETGYYSIKENNIMLISTEGEKDQLILSSSEVGDIKIESFLFSQNKNKILLFTKSVKVWRYNTRGDYWVYDFKTNQGKKVGKSMPDSSLMFAKFSPNEKFVAFVSKEKSDKNIRNSSTSVNIYIEILEDNSIKKLTSSNGTEKLINGTFDWVYEEEFGCRDGFIFNESGNKIAFWQIDANQVRDFYMINNTDSIYSYTIPVEYPKVGEDLTPAKIGVINLDNGEIQWMNIPGESHKYYLSLIHI